MLTRQILKTFLRASTWKPQYIANILIKQPAYSFNTAPPGKKILDVWDIQKPLYLEMSDALDGAYTCKQLANLLKDNVHQITDYQVSFTIFRIYNDEIPLDDHFYNVILPIVKEFVKNFDRNHNKSLWEIVQYCGLLKVQDKDFWALIEQKMVGQKLYRYIPTKELCKIAYALAEANQGSKELFGVIERTLIKQRLNLLEHDIDLARGAFQARNEGSELLFQVFENPRAELPGLEKKPVAQLHH